jgi:hypothetical protein
MPSLAQLETQTRELLAAIKVLASHSQTAEGSIEATAHGVSPLTALGGMDDTKRARESVLESLTKLQVMVAGPTDVLQHMACQVYSTVSFLLSHSCSNEGHLSTATLTA